MASGKHEPLKGTTNPKGLPGEAAVPDPYGVKEQESEDGLTVAKMILGAQQGDFNTDTSKWLARAKFLARCFMDQEQSTKEMRRVPNPPVVDVANHINLYPAENTKTKTKPAPKSKDSKDSEEIPE